MLTQTFDPFFSPKGIVVVGASTDPTKLGFGIARNLIVSRYPGAVHFVNPKGGRLFGRPIYRLVCEVPDPVDLAVILIPAEMVADVIRDCGERGIRAVIIASGGFRETGEEGAALEAGCLEVAREYGIRLIGPNCIGLLDTNYPLDTTFLSPSRRDPGEIAFISHSGAICAAVLDWARGRGFGFSRLISLGNQVDISEAEILPSVAADPHTRVITMYLESVKDGRRFTSQALKVSGQGQCPKPIIALKVGRSEGGQRAVTSHTGALAGLEAAFDAAFQRSGVLRANTTEEMFDWARTLCYSPLPAGRNVAILTHAGGPGVTAADAIEAHHLCLASLQEQTRQALKALLPPAASVNNPVDMLASASSHEYRQCLRLLLDDPGVDSVIVILLPPPMYTAAEIAKGLIPIIQTAQKPVLIALMGDRLIQEAVEHLRAAHIPEYRFPERAVSALAALTRRAEMLKYLGERPISVEDIDFERARTLVKDWKTGFGEMRLGAATQGILTHEMLTDLFKAYRIPIQQLTLAQDADQAVTLASQIGMPVVLKVASPDIFHKSDIGGVLLNLDSEDAVAQGYATLIQRAHAARPNAKIQGVYVQRMLPRGQEVITGVVRDALFGAIVMFGSGGIETEGLKDVAFALAPLTRRDAQRLLENTWAGRKLKGYRHLPPADREATLNVLFRLAQMAVDFPAIAELEINPLLVMPQGEGAIAVDVRGRLD